jgi:hypothetical protein
MVATCGAGGGARADERERLCRPTPSGPTLPAVAHEPNGLLTRPCQPPARRPRSDPAPRTHPQLCGGHAEERVHGGAQVVEVEQRLDLRVLTVIHVARTSVCGHMRERRRRCGLLGRAGSRGAACWVLRFGFWQLSGAADPAAATHPGGDQLLRRGQREVERRDVVIGGDQLGVGGAPAGAAQGPWGTSPFNTLTFAFIP